jgi:hypothetical protein
MQESENARQYRIIDQMLSMHSSLRDRYRMGALIMSCALLTSGVVLNACVFIDDATLTTLGLRPGNAKVAIGLASIAVFLISIIELRVDWGGIASSHKRAVEKLSNLKARYRQHFDPANKNNPVADHELSGDYERVLGDLPPIPEADFYRLKGHHLKKKLLSERISQNPGAPLLLLKLQILLQAIRKLAKNKEP